MNESQEVDVVRRIEVNEEEEPVTQAVAVPEVPSLEPQKVEEEE
jgi:hypothetical protein